MMRPTRTFLAILWMTALLTACHIPPPPGPRNTTGPLFGAVSRDVACAEVRRSRRDRNTERPEYRFPTFTKELILGALLNSEIGLTLDRDGRNNFRRATQDALKNKPDLRTSSWKSPEGGHHGIIMPLKTYYSLSGHPCRNFKQTLSLEESTRTAYGTGCRIWGIWKTVLEDPWPLPSQCS